MRKVGTSMHVGRQSSVLKTIDEESVWDGDSSTDEENDALIMDCYSVETSCWTSCWDSCIKCLDTDWFIVF